MKAFVYWNLRKKVYSVRDTRTGRIAAHSSCVILHDAQFVVSEAGRQRVLRQRKKNVHAGVRGRVEFTDDVCVRGWARVMYNPYKYDTFVRARDETPLEGAEEVRMVIRRGKAQVYARGLKVRQEASLKSVA